MLKVFRKIRQKLMTKNLFRKYLAYAFGEIILVVIGILIAVQIDDWNTNRKEIARLNDILELVKSDLVKDTLNIKIPIKRYEKKNARILDIIEKGVPSASLDTIAEFDTDNPKALSGLVIVYDLYQMQNKGISLLKNVGTNIDYDNDSLITNLLNNHAEFKLYFEEDNKAMNKLQAQNIEDFEKYPWFTDWVLQKYNKDMFNYFYSEEFQRKTARFSMYSIQFLGDLKLYDSISKTYIELIDKRLID